MCVASRRALLTELVRFFFVGVLNTALGLGIIYSLKWSPLKYSFSGDSRVWVDGFGLESGCNLLQILKQGS